MITEAYREQNRLLHDNNPSYGVSGAKWREYVRNISDWGRLSILDYGCGKQTLAKSLGPAYRVTNYDPCIPGLDAAPEPHDVVVCGDVMEHVEPEMVDEVLADIRKLAKRRAFFVIAQHESKKQLPDGRNTHLSVHDGYWWVERLAKAGFRIVQRNPDEAQEYNAWFIAE